MEITKSIYTKALSLGYENCGIISVNEMKGYGEKLEERIEKLPETKGANNEFFRFVHLEQDYPRAKSVIVCTRKISSYRIPENLLGVIGKSHAVDARLDSNSTDYQSSIQFENFLHSLGLKTKTERKFGITSLRWAAYKAGLGIIRRNNFFYTLNGSWIFIEAWLTDREMELIQTNETKPCPPDCKKCMEACPAKSLSAPYTMNINSCVASLTGLGGDDLINDPNSQYTGSWLYGCDVCQDVCPFNKNKWDGSEEFPGLNRLADSINLENILTMDYDKLENIMLPKFWYVEKNRLWKWKIRALNAIKNNYDSRFDYLIELSLNDSDKKVRTMAQWVKDSVTD